MTDFSLSRRASKVVAETVKGEDGRELPVDADFRTVLKCLRVLKDPELKESEKRALVSHWFLKGVFRADCVSLLCAFLDGGSRPAEEESEPVMDFEQDADAIYASFHQVYGIDLIDIPFLHWRKFRALLGGLGGDCALGRRIALRTMDTGKMPPQERAKAEKAKRSVQLAAVQMTEEEERLQHALDEALASGQDPAQAVRALNEYYDRMSGEA